MNRTYFARYEPPPPALTEKQPPQTGRLSSLFGNLFSNVAIDDLILLAVILILITDEQPDMITILALIYIFLV